MINDLPIVPGLYGFGTDTRAAYGASNDPVIFIVTDLTTNNGTPGNSIRNGTPVKTGSFLEAVNYNPPANTGKIILFEVSGTINATSGKYRYNIDYPYTTIAGQTAPSPGITLRNIVLSCGSHDVLLQHIRSRVGDAVVGEAPHVRRPIQMAAGTMDVYNVVFDHTSGSWGIDTLGVFWGSSYDNYNNTWSNSFFSEGLHISLHPDGPHSKGPAIQTDVQNISFFNNFMISNLDRNPYVRRSTNVIVNNYIYNPGDFNIIVAVYSDKVISSMVGNVVEGGPSSHKLANTKIPIFWSSLTNESEIYLDDNKCDAGTQNNPSDWSYVRWGGGLEDKTTEVRVLSPPIWPVGLVAMDSDLVKEYVLNNSGARPADRDSVDTRIVNEANSGTGSIKDCVENSTCTNSAGGWPVLAENHITLSIPSNPHDDSGNGYTNLEVWLHNLAAEVEGAQDPCEGIVCSNICVGDNLWSQKCVNGLCVADQLLESNSLSCGYDPCEGIVCGNICVDKDLWSQKCVNGLCVADQLLESNSLSCGYDPCEGVICNNVCIGTDLWSQKCVNGLCVADQLIASNSTTCGYNPCEGVVCGNTCVGDDLWSQRCDPDTGDCIPNQLIQSGSINCIIPEQIPSDDSTIQTYLILGGFGIMGLAMLILSKNNK